MEVPKPWSPLRAASAALLWVTEERAHTAGAQHGEGEPGALSEPLPSTLTTLSHAGHHLCHHLVGNQPIYLPLWVFVSSSPNGGDETSHMR